jgi:transposase
MYSKEICESCIKYYDLHVELTIRERITNIKQIFNIGRTTFYKILKNGFEPKFPKSKSSKVNDKVSNFIKRYVGKQKIIDVSKVLSIIQTNYGIKISQSYFYVILKKLNLTHKKVYIKKQPYSNKKYKSLVNKFYHQINELDQGKIISIDETAIFLNSKNNYGWAMKGCKCILKEKTKSIYKKKYSLLMAISNKQVIYYELHEKNINGKIYLNFIKYIIEKWGTEYTLLLNNAGIHKTKQFKEFTKEKK